MDRFVNELNPKRIYKLFYLAEQATVFEQNIRQLVEQLEHFVFLYICGRISKATVKAYRSMTQIRFPNCRNHTDVSRFCLWL